MKATKIISDSLDSCYAVGRITNDIYDFLIVASETENSCFSYDVNNNFEKSVVWETIGGTMSVVQIPGTMDFLATQKFYPGFNSEECQIVYGKFNDGKWEINKLIDFPYLHRFDLIELESKEILFIGCTIANSKKFVEDWSDDGKIFIGEFDMKTAKIVNLEEIEIRLKKNHGYYSVKELGYSLITAVEGVYKFHYPKNLSGNNWKLTKIFNEEISDIVQIDMNNDGELENFIIQGFHGDTFRILNEDFTEELYQHPHKTPFGHAIWAGNLLDQEIVLFGWREELANLIAYTFEDGKFEIHNIEKNVASSNCFAFEKNGRTYVFSANNGINNVGIYELNKEEK